MDASDTKTLLPEVNRRMTATLEHVRHELAGVRTGRASVTILDSVHVEAYGAKVPLNQVAGLSVPEPTLIIAQPFDPSLLGTIEKAIRASDLGLAPNSDGKIIRLTVPPMSGEQRQKMVARIKKLAEEAKVAIRNIRRDANKHFETAEKNKEMTEDERDKGKENVQELTKNYEDKVTDLADKKSKEVMEQ